MSGAEIYDVELFIVVGLDGCELSFPSFSGHLVKLLTAFRTALD
jgi:hypothetical protein